MCEYCHIENNPDNLKGDDGICFDNNKNKFYLYIEHYYNEHYKIEVNYCPKCGVKLTLLND